MKLNSVKFVASILLGLGIIIGLAGCGQSGPLYLPDDGTSQSQVSN